MTVKRISSGAGLPAGFPFSLASEANGIVFTSGMAALHAGGAKIEFQAVAAVRSGR